MPSKQYRDIEPDEAYHYATKYPVNEAFESENHTISIIEYGSGEEAPASYHHDPIEEYNVVLEGTLEIELGDDVVVADEGTVTYVPPGTPHAPRNPYVESATLLLLYAPAIPLMENTTLLE